ncbi:hypothetical protein FB45DRAFT_1033193 [Roridomyces roridus]|uniref:Uncharacterized protein n=1 Tax=Roridomyces roridus TaxID=1738132 RepID=A0AAD7FEH8_9AGAR|nr:hypothetical protein FB45DRAFT_1033193 [Roridomyces roridus]
MPEQAYNCSPHTGRLEGLVYGLLSTSYPGFERVYYAAEPFPTSPRSFPYKLTEVNLRFSHREAYESAPHHNGAHCEGFTRLKPLPRRIYEADPLRVVSTIQAHLLLASIQELRQDSRVDKKREVQNLLLGLGPAALLYEARYTLHLSLETNWVHAYPPYC